MCADHDSKLDITEFINDNFSLLRGGIPGNAFESDDDALGALAYYIAKGAGISGHKVSNGADYYKCTFCHAEQETMGHISSLADTFDDVIHDKDCLLLKLLKYISSRQTLTNKKELPAYYQMTQST